MHRIPHASHWHPTMRLRWSQGILQQEWIRIDYFPEIAESVPYQRAQEWRDVPTEESDVNA